MYLPFFSERRGREGISNEMCTVYLLFVNFFFLLSWDFKLRLKELENVISVILFWLFFFFFLFRLCHHQRDRPSFLLCKLPFPFLPLHIKEVFFFSSSSVISPCICTVFKEPFVYVFAIKKENAIKKTKQTKMTHLWVETFCYATTHVTTEAPSSRSVLFSNSQSRRKG